MDRNREVISGLFLSRISLSNAAASGLLDCQGVGACRMIQAVGNELANWRLHELFETRDDHVYPGAMAGACGPSVSM